MKKAIFLLSVLIGCKNEAVLVRIDGEAAITQSDIPEYAYYLSEESFYNFLDSMTDVKLILLAAKEENYPRLISSDIEDLERMLIIDSLWGSIQDSLLEEHDSLAYKYWEWSQYLVRAFLVRLPPERYQEARAVADSMKIFLNDSLRLKEYVGEVCGRYNFKGLYFGPAGDLRDFFPYAVSFSLAEELMSMEDMSVSEPIVTDTGIFIFARIKSTKTSDFYDFEEIKENLKMQEKFRFLAEQSNRMIDRLRSGTDITFNIEIFDLFSKLPHFERVLEEEPVVLPDLDSVVLDEWLAVAGDDTIFVGDMIDKIKSGRVLYPDLSDTSLLRFFLMRDVIPPYLLIQEAQRRGITLEGNLRSRFEKLRDSLVYESYIVSHTGSEVDSQEAYAYYLSNPGYFTIPERQELFIIGTTDSLFTHNLLDSVSHGVPFETLATRYSVLPSAPSGGDLGYVVRGRYREEVENLIFSLEPESFSQPIFLDGYWVLFKTGLHKTDSLLPFTNVFDKCKYLYQYELRSQMTSFILETKGLKSRVEIDSSALRNLLRSKKEEI